MATEILTTITEYDQADIEYPEHQIEQLDDEIEDKCPSEDTETDHESKSDDDSDTDQDTSSSSDEEEVNTRVSDESPLTIFTVLFLLVSLGFVSYIITTTYLRYEGRHGLGNPQGMALEILFSFLGAIMDLLNSLVSAVVNIYSWFNLPTGKFYHYSPRRVVRFE